MRHERWKLRGGLQNLLRREDGQDLVEYVLLAALISTAIITVMRAVATQLIALVNHIVATLATVLSSIL